MVKYVYDAWGNHAVVDINGEDITEGIGVLNPFRYRGYYYDTETGLYYLQTRYYDPEIGRFISQDSIDYADPKTINGLNLYAYCGNNPVMAVDPNGTSWKSFWSKVGRFLGGLALTLVGAAITPIVPTLGNFIGTEYGLTMLSYGVALMGSVFNSDIYSDMSLIGWNPFNTNADIVTSNAKIISFYKGAPVFFQNCLGGSVTFGPILFYTNHAQDPNEVLKHERGHFTQFKMMGLFRYLTLIGIPSVIANGDETPWELSANMLGGSLLGDNATSKQRKTAWAYLALLAFPFANVYSFFLD